MMSKIFKGSQTRWVPNVHRHSARCKGSKLPKLRWNCLFQLRTGFRKQLCSHELSSRILKKSCLWDESK